jgi:hypothetical protein
MATMKVPVRGSDLCLKVSIFVDLAEENLRYRLPSHSQ